MEGAPGSREIRGFLSLLVALASVRDTVKREIADEPKTSKGN
ncbi:hypothetical protein [Mesorhizobium sp. B2-5-4]|nr:hypothetical protein [Mesorhizobium sp. B2-5-4]